MSTEQWLEEIFAADEATLKANLAWHLNERIKRHEVKPLSEPSDFSKMLEGPPA